MSKRMTTEMTPHKYAVIAAFMAHSNMGLPTKDLVPVAQRLLRADCKLDMSVEEACGHLSASWIESDEIERAFYDEARMWETQIKDMGMVRFYKTWTWFTDIIPARELVPNFDQLLELEEAMLCRS